MLNASIYSSIFNRVFPKLKPDGPPPGLVAPPGAPMAPPMTAPGTMMQDPAAPPEIPPGIVPDLSQFQPPPQTALTRGDGSDILGGNSGILGALDRMGGNVDRQTYNSQVVPPTPMAPSDATVIDSTGGSGGAGYYRPGDARLSLPGAPMNAPTATTPKEYRKAEKEAAAHPPMPEFEGSPEEIALQEAEWSQKHPTDQDQGWKGRIREIASNFLYSMGQMPMDADWKAVLAAGGMGAGAGAINKTWNEQRAAQAAIPGLRQQVDFSNKQTNIKSEITARGLKTKQDAENALRSQLDKTGQQALDRYKARPTYKHGEDPEIDKLNMPDKGVNDKWHLKEVDLGDSKKLLWYNETTQETKEAADFSKSTKITATELPDDVFGLLSDGDIKNAATARVAKGMPTKAYRPEVVGALPASVKNPDGSFNLDKFIKQKEAGSLAGVELGSIMGDLPDNSQQTIAREAEKIAKEQEALKREVPIFRGALGDNRPLPDAKPVPRTKVISLFQQIMTLPNAKERAKKLEAFYANLPNIRVQ